MVGISEVVAPVDRT